MVQIKWFQSCRQWNVGSVTTMNGVGRVIVDIDVLRWLLTIFACCAAVDQGLIKEQERNQCHLLAGAHSMTITASHCPSWWLFHSSSFFDLLFVSLWSLSILFVVVVVVIFFERFEIIITILDFLRILMSLLFYCTNVLGNYDDVTI